MIFEKWRKYFSEDLWKPSLSEVGRCRRLYLRWVRIGVLSARGFWKNQCFLYASSLTFYSLMSIVPLFAIVFAVARAFGLHEYLQNNVLERFEGQREAFAEIIRFAHKMIEEARGGILAAIGTAVLFLSVVTLFKNMEDAFNQIWQKKSRTWKRVLTDYSALIFLGPLLFLLSSSVTVFIKTELEGIIPGSARGILLAIPYAIFWALFTLVFAFIPNTRVRISSASVAGIIATVLYLLVQGAYVSSQISVARYGAIYGSFAALPLFLIWLQLSWSILLLGGEVCHAHQTLEDDVSTAI